ncbi:MAG: EamA family transporter [Actinobacteria bacterium]|nr:EamA family transporter [Actinomycetota bacterium]
MRPPSEFLRTASPEALFAISGISQYAGAAVAINLFQELPPATVAFFRVAAGALLVLSLSVRQLRGWTAADLRAAAVFGIATALMNLFFYLAIDRLPLGKSVVLEFIGPISVAAVLTRTRRNTIALVLAASGVAILSGVEISGEPLGIAFILAASAMWAAYIVLGRRVASLDRGLGGLAVGLVIGSVVILPFGVRGFGEVFGSGRLLGLCVLVGLLSSAIGYTIDQMVIRRIPIRRFALLLALLPVTAMGVGYLALSQRPTPIDIVGAALVIAGVVTQERDEIAQPLDEVPA